jgi:hypothetical protein
MVQDSGDGEATGRSTQVSSSQASLTKLGHAMMVDSLLAASKAPFTRSALMPLQALLLSTSQVLGEKRRLPQLSPILFIT